MARFSTILSGVMFAAVCLSAAEAQTTGAVFPRRTQATLATQQAPQTVQNPGQPPTAPIKPSPDPVQQMAQPTANNQQTIPASPPVVTYHDGLLTVQASNSSLNSVLTAIRSKTGIEFEGQENVGDRVALALGPAPAGEVLSSIFAGSRFDFVAIGRQDNPVIVKRVILTPKSQPGATAAAQQQTKPSGEGDEEDTAGDDTPSETPNVGDPQDTPAQPPPPVTQPQSQTQPKTQEQLLQELMEMRKQQQQQQQQQQGDQKQGGDQNPAQVPSKQPPL